MRRQGWGYRRAGSSPNSNHPILRSRAPLSKCDTPRPSFLSSIGTELDVANSMGLFLQKVCCCLRNPACLFGWTFPQSVTVIWGG